MQQPSDIAVFELEESKAAPAIAPGEIVIGTVTAIDAHGQPLIDYPDNPLKRPLSAMSTLGITSAHIGRNVALLFADGDRQRPVIMGIIHSPLQELILAYDARSTESASPAVTAEPPASASRIDDVAIDGKRVVLEGKEEVVLRCGEASITLTKTGKILIRGHYVMTRATGINRILGGAVQVN